jgi:LPXTG-site transpeptidase (sortase) family protein
LYYNQRDNASTSFCMNQLFPDEPQHDGDKPSRPATHTDNPAVEMIRRKMDAAYSKEPNAAQEMAEVEHTHGARSRHQQFMHRLTTSGKSMAEIQAAWHDYYQGLPDDVKHEVWQEFYKANAQTRAPQPTPEPTLPTLLPVAPKPVVVSHQAPAPKPKKSDRRSVADIKQEVLKHVRSNTVSRQKAHKHLQSLAFGLGMGALVLLIAMFGLFNELVVAPFIRPGSAAATPIILNANAPAPNKEPELIIPKLNAQLPVVYGGQSLAEPDVQKALEKGIFHYPTTATPGQNGNVAVFGHSSNNIFNKGKYKFAFVLLRELEPGDIFHMTYDAKIYTYKVYGKKVVTPDETWILGPVEDKTATAVLITCDPPGSTRHRLAVWGEQISPDPGQNSDAASPSEALQTQALPGKGPSALSRFWRWLNPLD